MDDFERADSTTSSISSEDMDMKMDSVSSASWDSIDGPLYTMSSLKDHLPRKNGLSKFFVGKSQSFASLADVKCLEDLAKPQNSYKRKKPKSARLPRISRGSISKRPLKGSFGCKMAKKGIQMSHV